MAGEPVAPSLHTAAANEAVRLALPFDDVQDFEDARRGFVATLSPLLVQATDGRVVWDMDSYGFLHGGCPDSVNPSLWRQAQLAAIHGLFEIAPGFFQVRGLDLSNMTLIEGDRGVVIIDPLISSETAAAALALYRRHRGDRPVTGLIYTHSHVDHFGGAKGVLSVAEADAGVPVIAPQGFVEHAIAENVYAGTAMSRRATYMYGAALPRGPRGQVSAGLGPTNSTGTVTLIQPNVEVTATGQELVVDGVRMVFQLTPGTEAPAEMNFFFPDHRLLCMAENATHNLHNVLTLRGALVRDPRVWSRYLDETITLWGADTEMLFASHHWPTWGNERAVQFLADQRDLYGWIHDQTLRLLNQGHTGAEIAESLDLPSGLAGRWHCRGYYGTVNHNTKAVYQRYMGWFDGNPAHLWPHPPEAAAVRYLDYMGGADAVVERARRSYEDGDYRWVAEVLSHVVFAQPDHLAARELEAAALEQLGYQAESGPWRNFFLQGAQELRGAAPASPAQANAPDIVTSLTPAHLFDVIGIRLDGPRAAGERIVVNWSVDGHGEVATNLSNGVLTYRVGTRRPDADATVVTDHTSLLLLTGSLATVAQLVEGGSLRVDGDTDALVRMFDLLDQFDPGFDIVLP